MNFLLIKISLTFIFCYFIYNYIFTEGINIDNHYSQFRKKINEKNLNLLLSKKKAKIEKIFLLLKSIPFIKKKIIIKMKNNKDLYIFIKDIFKIKKINNGFIYINKKDFKYIIKYFNEIIYYEWELIPKKFLINDLRFVINNYYNEICLEIFDNALNYNLQLYIKNNKKILNDKDIINLMSKYYLFIFCQKILEFIKKFNV